MMKDDPIWWHGKGKEGKRGGANGMIERGAMMDDGVNVVQRVKDLMIENSMVMDRQGKGSRGRDEVGGKLLCG
jgi:hypothetical protein